MSVEVGITADVGEVAGHLTDEHMDAFCAKYGPGDAGFRSALMELLVLAALTGSDAEDIDEEDYDEDDL